MRHAFEINGVEHEVWLARGDELQPYVLHVGDQSHHTALAQLSAEPFHLQTLDDNSSWCVAYATEGDLLHLWIEGHFVEVRYRHPLDRASAETATGHDDVLRAPMPGTTIIVNVRAGDTVTRGQPLLVMESMKLETTLAAMRDAVIRTVYVTPGQSFDRDAVLLELEPVAEARP